MCALCWLQNKPLLLLIPVKLRSRKPIDDESILITVSFFQPSLASPGDDLMRCVDLYNQTQSKWFEEMVTTSMVKQQHHKITHCQLKRYRSAAVYLRCLLMLLVSLTLQELEKLEVERIEWIQQHLRQYTTLRHETDMFNQSVSLLFLAFLSASVV